MIIYKTTNLINKKIYIGQDTKNNPNYLGSGKYFKYALKKYGKENFSKEIIEFCDSIISLNECEKYWINFYGSTNKSIGYNISLGGQSGFMIGLQHSDETKKKFSINRKGKLVGRENGMFGKHHTTESKKKMSRPQFGDKNGMYGNKVSGDKNHFYNKKHSEDSIIKIKEAALKRKTNPNSKKVFAEGLVFNSGSEAAKYFNISHGTVGYRCKNNNFDWYWVI